MQMNMHTGKNILTKLIFLRNDLKKYLFNALVFEEITIFQTILLTFLN